MDIVVKAIIGVTYLGLVAAIALGVDRLKAALAAVAIAVSVSIFSTAISPLDALHYIDLDVLGLIVFASAISWFMEDCGLVNIIALKIVRSSKGSVLRLTLLTSIIGGLLSTFMENVSVVLILSPIVITTCRMAGVNSVPIVVMMALSVNIAGSALLVGDPQAAIIASRYNLGFFDFIYYLGKPSMLVIVLISMLTAITLSPTYAKLSRKLFNHSFTEIKLPRVNRKYVVAVVLALTAKIALLSLRKELGLSLTASAAAPTIVLIAFYGLRKWRELLKAALDYRLLLFIASMFYLVGFMDKSSLTTDIANIILLYSGSAIETSALLILFSALASSVIDNIPIITAMIPVVNAIANYRNVEPVVIAWGLLIGATIGGNATYIGASANYTAVRILEKHGENVSFMDFLKIGGIYALVSLIASTTLYYLFYYELLNPPP
ncbi:MAG: SLC13 family permease [Sulfolobales archaeon]|nr:SLC13 family permease [Sulfolobales archaeon]MCX8198955.1 SLC13 family permease [Sulfolobales archaeon]MDW8169933.1 SLC13 family permease [Desulfurococcaceae archaeon]